MISPRDAAYSLFGGPLILDVGPTINGEIIRVRVQPINAISVSALVISLLLFLIFMWFYLYPLFRNRRPVAAAERARTRDAEQPGSLGTQIDEEEKSSLISWLHFRSRDRFSTAHDSPYTKASSKLASPVPIAPGLARQPSSFARGSLIPHLSPVTLTPPPPAYASRPNSPLALAEFRFPSPVSSPRSDVSRSPRSLSHSLPSPTLPASASPGPGPAPSRASAPRVQFDPRTMPSRPQTPSPLQGRNRSRSSTAPSRLAVRPVMAPRSVSANTLHPTRVDLHVPSRARVYAAGQGEGGDSAIRRVARPREGTSGIGLAQRGRILTRGPSSSWSPSVGNIGQPF
ncbi:hypothetical protein DFH07DRAFT_820517 [Mycena maculata]|uniref:Uncharacterized protein n=1 Tax=Mycena maculata TaxID=230809 RepID=A0AAD7J3V5_9AGAR|nr:hypothetical protein DFH07DRAFT_820517 [Mycena maculata]